MSEQTKAPSREEQIKQISQSLNQIPFIIFMTSLIGGLSLAFSSYFYAAGYFRFEVTLIGLTVFVTCTSLSTFLARNVKEQYKKLIQKLND